MADLRTLHAELLELIDSLEAMTARPTLDGTALASLRYKLTRTSTARRKLVASLCAELEPRLTGEAATQVKALRESVTTGFALSSDHISNWSMRQIERDWAGYCAASSSVRRAMRAQIERERQVLYPHLDG